MSLGVLGCQCSLVRAGARACLGRSVPGRERVWSARALLVIEAAYAAVGFDIGRCGAVGSAGDL